MNCLKPFPPDPQLLLSALDDLEEEIRSIVAEGEQSDDTANALLWLADIIQTRSWEDLPSKKKEK